MSLENVSRSFVSAKLRKKLMFKGNNVHLPGLEIDAFKS